MRFNLTIQDQSTSRYPTGQVGYGSLEGEERPDVEAFVVDGPKEAFDLAVGLRRVRTEQVMGDAHRATGLLKARLAIGVLRMPHGEGKRVVGQDRFDRIRQSGRDLLQERRGGGTGRFGRDPDDGFPAEVVDRRELEVMRGVPQGRQVFEVDVNQLARPLFFVPPRLRPRRPRQLIHVTCSSSTRCTVPWPMPECVANPRRRSSAGRAGRESAVRRREAGSWSARLLGRRLRGCNPITSSALVPPHQRDNTSRATPNSALKAVNVTPC
jgi:hypothetical protein